MIELKTPAQEIEDLRISLGWMLSNPVWRVHFEGEKSPLLYQWLSETKSKLIWAHSKLQLIEKEAADA